MLPPRVLVVTDEQWPRAGLRAELRAAGYDAVGARDLFEALVAYPRDAPGRGAVALLVIDQDAIEREGGEGPTLLERLHARHGRPPIILLAHATRAAPAGPWTTVLRRPVTVGAIVDAVRALVPLPASAPPLDE
jgi:DNA-binding NtrC family response regulator